MSLPVVIDHCAFLLLAMCLFACGSGGTQDKEEQQEANSSTSMLSADSSLALKLYTFDSDPEIFKLVKGLAEISGIAFTADGRLFAHGDEQGTIYQLDPESGEVLKRFNVGNGLLGDAVEGDFEDIAIVNDNFYLVRSDGILLKFREGEDGEEVEYDKYETPLKSKNDVEGLCYDPSTSTLLLACKADPGKGYDNDMRAVYSFSPTTGKLDEKPRFLIDEKRVTDITGESSFNPSSIIRHPATGTFLVMASSGNALAELSPEGKLLGVQHLPKDVHPQPEGIAVSPDGMLYISDEGRGGKGRLSRYSERRRE